MNKYCAEDNWSIEMIDGRYYFCFINPGHTGEDVRLPVTPLELEYAIKENPNFDEMMELLKTRKMI